MSTKQWQLYSDDKQFRSGIYRVIDPIKNFRLKVILEKSYHDFTQSKKERAFENRVMGMSGKAVPQSLRKATQEVATLSWQQKVFSYREIIYYSENRPYDNSRDRKYHEEVTKIKFSQLDRKRIFTYIEGDSFLDELVETGMTTSPNEKSSLVARNISLLHRCPFDPKRKEFQPANLLKAFRLITPNPRAEEKLYNRASYSPLEYMFVVADLSPETRTPTASDEYILCSICYKTKGYLIILPDFNHTELCYSIITCDQEKGLYHYRIENISCNIDKDSFMKEVKLFSELAYRHKRFLTQLVGTECEMPSKNSLRIYAFCEIMSVSNFEYDNLHVYYRLTLPPDWRVNPCQLMSGLTQTSHSSDSESMPTVYFAHPFELEMTYEPCETYSQGDLPRMPKLHFQVTSVDSWKRSRVEGYTFITIPSLPGSYEISAPCWRPAGKSIRDELARFFIGSSRIIEDISYCSFYENAWNEGTSVLSRFGFRSMNSGTLNFRVNVVFQSRLFAPEYGASGERHDSGFGFEAYLARISEVINAYNTAKEKLIEAREKAEDTLKR